MCARRQAQVPAAARGSRQPQVRMPSECHGHGSPARRHDGRVDGQLTVAGGDGELDPVGERERRRVDIDRRVETGGAAAGRASSDPPPGPADEQAVDRQAVCVTAELQAVEVDGDARCSIAARAEAVRPWRQQRQSQRLAGAQRRQTAGEGEVLVTAAAQRDAGHPETGEERGGELAGGERHRRLAPEPLLNHRFHSASPPVASRSWTNSGRVRGDDLIAPGRRRRSIMRCG